MDSSGVWKKFFLGWPADLHPSGVLVLDFGEQVPFEGFHASEELLLIERKAPDTVGARKLLVSYGEVRAIKITEVVKPQTFAAAGFRSFVAPTKQRH